MRTAGNLVRLSGVALLALSVVTCGKDGTGPTPLAPELVIVTPDAGVRAVMVEIGSGTIEARPYAGYSLFVERNADATTVVVVPEGGRTFPTGATSVASLDLVDGSSQALTAKLRQAAAPDYQLLRLDDISARVAARSRSH